MKWCSFCKTLHAEGAHTRPQPVSLEVEVRSLRALLLERDRELKAAPAAVRAEIVERLRAHVEGASTEHDAGVRYAAALIEQGKA